MNPPDAPAFTETQWFYRRWWWLLAGSTVLMLGLPLLSLPREKLSTALWLLPLLLAPVLALIWSIRLTVRVDAVGVHYQFLPVLNRWRHWPWSEFREVFPRVYSPFLDYGGWGLRGLPGNLAYNIWGPYGLQLVFRSGNRLLLGTQRPNELRAILAALRAANDALPIKLSAAAAPGS